MQAGDKIRLTQYMMGHPIGTEDYTVELFRFCLGVFESDQHREIGRFTPLCELYEYGPDSEKRYMSNMGDYVTNMVPSFMNLPRD